MKKLIVGMAVLVLLGGVCAAFGPGVSAATATPTPPPPTSTGSITTDRVEGRVTAYALNVRTGPGTAYPIIGGLRLGDSVEVMGKNAAGTWLQIAYNGRGEFNGQGSWIAAAYVDLTGSLATVPEVSAPPPPPPTPTPDELATLRPGSGQARPTETELTGKLVFQTSNGGDIYVINADGTGLRRLTDGMEPAWSLDGTKVAFTRWGDPRGLYVVDEDGSNETLVFGWVAAKEAQPGHRTAAALPSPAGTEGWTATQKYASGGAVGFCLRTTGGSWA
jgi:hypothetical protein